MRGAKTIDKYKAINPQEAFDIEYWSLEDAKLRRLPKDRELERTIVAIVGAGSGIGKATAHRLAKESAHVVCADLDGAAANATAQDIITKYGAGVGIAESGVSNCGPTIGLPCDI